MGGQQRAWTLAIDFGTTATVAAIDDGVTKRLTEFSASSTRMPSGVFVETDGSLLAGTLAANRSNVDPARYVRTPKRHIGDSTVVVGGRDIAVTDLISAVLRAAAAQAIRQAGDYPPARIVLTCPAAWGSTQRSVLLDAATAAGMAGAELVLEPVAAGLEVFDDGRPGARYAVYDLGGGTFDAAVVEQRTDGTLVPVGQPGGIDAIGGEAFDGAVHRYLLEQVKRASPESVLALDQPSTVAERGLARTWWRDVRSLKEDLSETPSGSIAVPGTNQSVLLTRAELEHVVRDSVRETIDELERTVRGAVGDAPLDGIALSGDASRMPLVGELVRLRFPGTEIRNADDPKGVVARGATAAPVAAAPIPPVFQPQPPPVGPNDAPIGDGPAPVLPVPPKPKPKRPWRVVWVGAGATAVLTGIAIVASSGGGGGGGGGGGSGSNTTTYTTYEDPTTNTTYDPPTTERTLPPPPAGPREVIPESVSATGAASDGFDACNALTTFGVGNLIDGISTTAWRVDGSGVGHRITIDLGVPTRVTRIDIIPGYSKVDECDSSDRFLQNRRILTARWYFDDGTHQDLSYDPDSRGLWGHNVDHVTTTLVMEILATTANPVRDFAAISEIKITETP